MKKDFNFLNSVVVISTLLASSLAGAAGKQINKEYQQRLDQSITNAIEFNKNSTFETWHTSSANFHGIFANLMNNLDFAAQVSICDALVKRSGEDLARMESEISEPEFAALFATCKIDLLQKANRYVEIMSAEVEQQYPPIVKVSLQNVETIVKKIENKNGGLLYDAGDLLEENEVIFTFDDGPRPEHTNKILDTLKEFNVKAIFFPVGNMIRSSAGKAAIKRIQAEGHPIGNHSYNHVGFRTLLKTKGMAACIEEIRATHQAVYDVNGSVMPFFRFPGGTANPELQTMVDQHRLLNWRWNIDSHDYSTPNPAELVAETIRLFEKHKKGIMLFHDIKPQTAAALPTILRELLNRGAKPVILVPSDDQEQFNPHPDLVKKRSANP